MHRPLPTRWSFLADTPSVAALNDIPGQVAQRLGLDAAKAYALELRDQALHALRPFDAAAEPLRDLARYIVSRRS